MENVSVKLSLETYKKLKEKKEKEGLKSIDEAVQELLKEKNTVWIDEFIEKSKNWKIPEENIKKVKSEWKRWKSQKF